MNFYLKSYAWYSLLGGVCAGLVAKLHGLSMGSAKEREKMLSDERFREKYFETERSFVDFVKCRN